jgi:small nuclear ribonucleoprotein (snRNP)-like protein
MSTSNITKRLVNEITNLVDRYVGVKLVDGRLYEGTLLGVDVSDRLTLHLVLGDAKDSDGNIYYRVIIHGDRISEILVRSQPLFDPNEFSSYISSKLNLPPGSVKVIREANLVIVYDKYKVSENGVEGSGPLASKLYSLYQEYVDMKKKRV